MSVKVRLYCELLILSAATPTFPLPPTFVSSLSGGKMEYSWPLNNRIELGPLTFGFFSTNTVNVFSHFYDFLNNTCSQIYFILRICYIIPITYKIYVNCLFMLSVWVLLNSKLLEVKCLGSQKLYVNFWLCRGRCPLSQCCSRVKCTLFKKAHPNYKRNDY